MIVELLSLAVAVALVPAGFHFYKRCACLRVHWLCDDGDEEWKLLGVSNRYVEVAVMRNNVKPGDLLALSECPIRAKQATNVLQVYNVRYAGDPLNCCIAQCRMLRVSEALHVLRNVYERLLGANQPRFLSPTQRTFYVPKDCVLQGARWVSPEGSAI
jgi:hypothetical protein